jgi:GWxTD domain-containing protein
MKKLLIFLSIGLTYLTVNAQDIQAYFDYKVFYVPGEGPMLESYLNVFGNTLIYKSLNDGEQASVQVLMLFKQGDEIIDYSKKTLLSPISPDSVYDDFLDVQRFSLKPGVYELELELSDLAFPDKVERVYETIEITEAPNAVFISDLQWVAAYKSSSEPGVFTKSGYDLLPYVSNYFPQSMSKMMFYAEIYGTEQVLGNESVFLFSAHVEKKESKKIIDSAVLRSKKTSGKVVPILSQFDIGELPTGNYTLVFEVRDRENNLLTTSAHVFQKAGKEAIQKEYDYAEASIAATFVSEMNSIDTLSEYIQCLRPISGEQERSLIARFERYKDLDMMKRFFYSFWKERNENQPDVAWQEYKAKVADVNRTYSTANKKGYDTDMGRVYLAYGPPNTVTDRPSEPSAYPYQIWQYYRADRWTNVRFVFYDRSLLRQDYELLHCDNIPGEIKNPRWDILIHQRDTPLKNVDDNQGRDHFGGRTQDYWITPR